MATAVITCVFSGLLEAWKEAANAFESSEVLLKFRAPDIIIIISIPVIILITVRATRKFKIMRSFPYGLSA